jgi:hypothetical protein
VGARNDVKEGGKIGGTFAFLRARGEREKGVPGENVGAPRNDSCPGPTPVAVDLLKDLLATELLLTDAKILW